MRRAAGDGQGAAAALRAGLTLSALLCAVTAAGCGGSPSSSREPDEVTQADAAPLRRLRGVAEIERMLRSAESSGYEMARVRVPLAEIPRVSVPPVLTLEDAEATSPSAPGFQVRDLAFVEGRERSWSCPSHGADRHPLCAACASPSRKRTVRAEGPLRGSGGRDALTYEIVDGVRDPSVPASLVEARRTRIIPRALLPSVLYAFRFLDEREPGIERVSFVLPPAIDFQVYRSGPADPWSDVTGAFSRATLPVRPGGSESVIARITSSAAAAWVERLWPGAPPPPVDDLVVGVELSQAGDGPDPELVAYVSRVPAAPAEE